MIVLDYLVHLIFLCTVVQAIPVSLIEDMKNSQLQAPVRTNKVKRAQEVLMFGNQQNRAINGYGNPPPETRSYGDIPLYVMDARMKRDAHKFTHQASKTSFRSKRDYDLSPDELVSLMRALESQRRQNKYHDQWTSSWPHYSTDNEETDFGGENPDENDIDSEPEYNRNGGWMDGPVNLGQYSRDSDNTKWPRKYKDYLVSKRKYLDNDNFQAMMPYDFTDGIPLQRRFIL